MTVKVNKIQDAFSAAGVKSPVDLPQIVVVGSQSSGKSSVLENIVGIDFLPRGTGIVTRRPLILQLIHRKSKSEKKEDDAGGSELNSVSNSKHETSDESSAGSPSSDCLPRIWAEFLHLSGRRFTNFDEVRNEIVRETELKTGKNAAVSSEPIRLRIYSPDVVTLTLVDCPGLTKVPVGDQPSNIESLIRDMILPFIRSPNSIILAVTSANTDIANSDGLKLAREVDPEGNRTIGVLTKVDLMDKGTDVVNILAGKVIPLRLGYIPVVNRGQEDIDKNKRISYALAKEKKFFEEHRSYCQKASYCGTPFLARKLNNLLMNHIKHYLPEMRSSIQNSLKSHKTELEALGYHVYEEVESSSNIILSVITEFCNKFNSMIDGTGEDATVNELSGGARVSYIFHQIFSNSIRAMNPFDTIKDVDIRTILQNTSGSSPAVFVGTQAFEILVKKQISLLLEPSLKCVKLVYDELLRIINKLLTHKTFKRFPVLKSKFYTATVNFFKDKMAPTEKLVTDIINAEMCYINTAHPQFISGTRVMELISGNTEKKRIPMSQPEQNQQSNDKLKKDPASPDAKTKTPSIETYVQPPDPNAAITLSAVNQDNFFGSFFAKKQKPGVIESPPVILKPSNSITERERNETNIIKILIQSYYNIVKNNVADMVPKIVMLNLISQIRVDLQPYLFSEIYRKNDPDSLLKENDEFAVRRSECLRIVEALQRADEIISSI